MSPDAEVLLGVMVKIKELMMATVAKMVVLLMASTGVPTPPSVGAWLGGLELPELDAVVLTAPRVGAAAVLRHVGAW